MTMTAGSTAGGAVYDRGYRPYEGKVGGRGAARWALFRLSVRRALGIRRSWRQKVLPWSLLALATLPAMINVGVKVAIGDQIDGEDVEFISYHDYVGVSLVLLLFLAVTAPDAVCPDRRNRVLPLVFSRPLTGVDYVLAKVGALAAVLFGFAFLPQVVLFVGQAFVSEDGALDYIGDNAEILWQVPLAVATLACYLAVIGVALSSLTSRRIVGGVAILGLALVSSVVASLLVHVDTEGTRTEGSSYGTEEVPAVEDTVPGEWTSEDVPHGDPRWEEYEQEGGFFSFEDYEVPDEERPEYDNGSAFALLDVFGVSLYLRDVIFLGHVDPLSQLGGVQGGGVMALLVYLTLVDAGLGVLLWRYREVNL